MRTNTHLKIAVFLCFVLALASFLFAHKSLSCDEEALRSDFSVRYADFSYHLPQDPLIYGTRISQLFESIRNREKTISEFDKQRLISHYISIHKKHLGRRFHTRVDLNKRIITVLFYRE